MRAEKIKIKKIVNTNLEIALHHLDVVKNNLGKATLNKRESNDLIKIEGMLSDLSEIKKKYNKEKLLK